MDNIIEGAIIVLRGLFFTLLSILLVLAVAVTFDPSSNTMLVILVLVALVAVGPSFWLSYQFKVWERRRNAAILQRSQELQEQMAEDLDQSRQPVH